MHGAQVHPRAHAVKALSAALTLQDIFFDLVVTANIDVYSGGNSLRTARHVEGFLSYVALLWWIWFSQIIFDVRFRDDHEWFEEVEDVASTGAKVGSSVSAADDESWGDDDDDDDENSPSVVLKRCKRVVASLQLVIRLAQTAVWFALTSATGQFGRGDYHTFAFICGLVRYSLAADYVLIFCCKVALSGEPLGSVQKLASNCVQSDQRQSAARYKFNGTAARALATKVYAAWPVLLLSLGHIVSVSDVGCRRHYRR